MLSAAETECIIQLIHQIKSHDPLIITWIEYFMGMDDQLLSHFNSILLNHQGDIYKLLEVLSAEIVTQTFRFFSFP